MEKTSIIIGIMSALAIIIAPIFPSVLNYKIEKRKSQKENFDISKSRKKKFSFFPYLIVIAILVVSISSFVLGDYFRNSLNKDNMWLGDWVQEEQRQQGISKGTLTFWTEGVQIKGVAYNKEFHLIILNGRLNEENILKGTWSNIITEVSGEFSFQFQGNYNNFKGNYTINGIKRDWNGYRFSSSEYTHLLASKTIALRNKALTGIDFNNIEKGDSKLDLETKLDVLIEGDKLKILGEEKQCNKVIVKSKQFLKMGYISKTLSGKSILSKIE